MSTRFECPRCQNVFEDPAADQAFAECPSCGSLGLPAGEMTTTSQAFSESSPDEFDTQVGDAPPSLSDELREAPPPGDSGVFGGLLQGADAEAPPGALSSLPEGEPEEADRAPTPPEVSGLTDLEGPTRAMDAQTLLTAAQASMADQAPATTQVGPPPIASADSSSAFGDADDDEEDEFDPFKGLDLPEGGEVDVAAPAEPAPGPGAAGEGTFAPVTFSADTFSEDSSSGAFADGAPEGLPDRSGPPADDATAVGPAPEGVDVAARAVTLSELEAQLPVGAPLEMFNPDAGQDLFGDEAFGDLERAFDDVASRPDLGTLPHQSQPWSAQDALLYASQKAELEAAGTPAAPKPPEAPQPPPLKLKRTDRPPHLSLSPEAVEAAALPIHTEEMSGRNRLPEGGDLDDRTALLDPFAEVPDRDEDMPAHLAEETDVIQRRPSPGAGETTQPRVVGVSADNDDEASDHRSGGPGLLSGFTLARVGIAAAVFLVVGLGLGAAVAPSPDDQPLTQRKRAEQIYAKGNRFYDEGRFDDALGDYRGALAIDPSFAQAHRAKGAALAKQRRYEEAAEAYREYLEVNPTAVDAEAVKEVLARYEGKKP